MSDYKARPLSKPVNKGKNCNGAEFLLINKNKFIKYLDFCTTSKLFSSLDVNLYAPTLEKFSSKMKWNGYKKNLVNHLTKYSKLNICVIIYDGLMITFEKRRNEKKFRLI